MTDFNLVERKWIPCLMLESNKPEEFGLLEILTRAHEIREIFDNSPLVTVALHRLLLAILHRNFGPKDFNAWKELWRRKQWDSDVLSRYLDEWKHRFNLFDEERPFYQVPRMQKGATGKSKKNRDKNEQVAAEEAELHPLALLAHESATGSNATLFDHSFKDAPSPLSFAAAARYLVSHQNFAVSGGVSFPFNLSNAPLVSGFVVLAIGNNLFETLMLNLLPYHCESDKPMPCRKDRNGKALDLPIWEQNDGLMEEPDKNGTQAKGYLDYLTWQSRQLHLIEPDEASETVLYCQRLQKLKLADDPPVFDPFKCYVPKEDKGWKVLDLNPNKALWRNSHILFQHSDAERVEKSRGKRPEVFNYLARIEVARASGEIEAKTAYRFGAYGFASKEVTQPANIILWTQERLPLPLSYLTKPQLIGALDSALRLADDFAGAVNTGVRLLADYLIPKIGKDTKARQEKVRDLTRSLGAEVRYWSDLETNFKWFLTDLPAAFQQENSEMQQENKPLKEWAKTLGKAADAAFEQAINSLSGSARELKAATAAKEEFSQKIGKIRKENPHLFPTKETRGGEG